MCTQSACCCLDCAACTCTSTCSNAAVTTHCTSDEALIMLPCGCVGLPAWLHSDRAAAAAAAAGFPTQSMSNRNPSCMSGMLLVAAWWWPRIQKCAILQAIVQQQCMSSLCTPDIVCIRLRQLGCRVLLPDMPLLPACCRLSSTAAVCGGPAIAHLQRGGHGPKPFQPNRRSDSHR